MDTPSRHEITEWLVRWTDGDQLALGELAPIVYGELHRLAQIYMRGERPGHALQTTALVNEAYLRLVDTGGMRWQNRAHFYAVAAKSMRRILIDFARSRDGQKRGGGAPMVSLDEALTVSDERNAELIELDGALTKLARLNERHSRIVELRFFVGLTEPEIAEVLQISHRTVSSEWSLARAWLMRELNESRPHDA